MLNIGNSLFSLPTHKGISEECTKAIYCANILVGIILTIIGSLGLSRIVSCTPVESGFMIGIGGLQIFLLPITNCVRMNKQTIKENKKCHLS